jgi:hypothetical protein
MNHISCLTISACKLLGFLSRISKYFKNESVLKISYYYKTRNKLEYCFVIWNLFTKKYIDTVEKVQKMFLRYKYYLHSNTYPLTDNYVWWLFQIFEFQ